MVSIQLLRKSFGHAIDGVILALEENQNLRIHFLTAFVVMILSLVFKVSSFEMGILGVMILLVISTEMLNTSVEKIVDLITQEHRKEAKFAKDVAAGMVLINAIGSVIVGCVVFIPHFLALFHI